MSAFYLKVAVELESVRTTATDPKRTLVGGVELDSDRLNRWLTLGANLAVLVGLVFLVIEINQNNEMMRAQTRSGITDAIIENVKMGMDPRVIVANQKQRSGQPLSDEESILLNQVASATLRLWENTHYQYRNGLFDDAEFEADLAVWRADMQKTEFREHWSSSRHTYSEAFRAQIDEIME